MSDPRGAAGYGEAAADLIPRYEALRFEDVHASVSHLFPKPPGAALDIGAGIGRDAAAFEKYGFLVTAIEPTDAFRSAGREKHPSSIQWIDDSLPELALLRDYQDAFDIIMMDGVWMHLDERERPRAMEQVARLLKPGGRVFISLRHGPVPQGRIMFDVSSNETTELAQHHGLKMLACLHEQSLQLENRKAGVTWSKLAFEKAK